MIRPSADPHWEEINPVWRALDGYREYEILGDVETHKEQTASGIKIFVSLTARSVGDSRWQQMSFKYNTPYRAHEVKQDIERYAYKIHFEKDQVPVGRLPQ